jgi:hypothetical protein
MWIRTSTSMVLLAHTTACGNGLTPTRTDTRRCIAPNAAHWKTR